MTVVSVDANILIAARLSRDQNHERGSAIADTIDQGQHPTAYVFTDVLEEVINYFEAPGGHDIGIKTLHSRHSIR